VNYYNEFDPKAAAWLRELIKAGHLPEGIVDERSITDIKPSELTGYTQCHFFAGIGGWSLALQLAGWPADRPVWTGSCPCQPFSAAGKHKGTTDERHLWPVFASLIAECRPPVVFGEQVPSAIGHQWLDGVCADMEKENYAVGAVVLGACAVGAPHRRQRLYWVAENTMADTGNTRPQGREGIELRERSCKLTPWADSSFISCRDGKTRRIPVEPSFQPLANGIPARVVRLRGYGNAIVPQVAAEFIKAWEAIT
jgi:DNA (cytosine-5)-methyltransferase 1